MWLNMKLKENTLLQKSRVRWDRKGNLISKYFLNILKARRQRNYIGNIVTDRGEVADVGDIKEEVRSHFEE